MSFLLLESMLINGKTIFQRIKYLGQIANLGGKVKFSYLDIYHLHKYIICIIMCISAH